MAVQRYHTNTLYLTVIDKMWPEQDSVSVSQRNIRERLVMKRRTDKLSVQYSFGDIIDMGRTGCKWLRRRHRIA